MRHPSFIPVSPLAAYYARGLAAGGCCALLLACSSAATVPRAQTTPASHTARAERAAPAPLAQRATGGDARCAPAAVYFPTDAAALDDSGIRQMGENLTCVQRLGARKLEIVGMADPRGTEDYNLALGNRRAHAVADYLAKAGVSASLLVRSAGEELATGTETAGWAHDRRTDIHLGE